MINSNDTDTGKQGPAAEAKAGGSEKKTDKKDTDTGKQGPAAEANAGSSEKQIEEKDTDSGKHGPAAKENAGKLEKKEMSMLIQTNMQKRAPKRLKKKSVNEKMLLLFLKH